MRLIYFAVCSALFLAFMGGMNWLINGVNEQFGWGVIVGGLICMPLGYYAGVVDQKRKKDPSAEFWD